MSDQSQTKQQRMSKWLTKQYLVWQAREGEKRSIKQFAQYLDVERATLEKWLYGSRLPSRRHVEHLAVKLGREIYDVMGIPRPDPRLQELISAWGGLPDELRRRIMELVGLWQQEERWGRSRVQHLEFDDDLDKDDQAP